MPVFIDRHPGSTISDDLRASIASDVKSHKPDPNGVITRAFVIDPAQNEMMCVTEAANADAVKRHHDAIGVPQEASRIHRADAIL